MKDKRELKDPETFVKDDNKQNIYICAETHFDLRSIFFQESCVGGALPVVLRGEEARGQRRALAGRRRGPVWTLPVGQVSL